MIPSFSDLFSEVVNALLGVMGQAWAFVRGLFILATADLVSTAYLVAIVGLILVFLSLLSRAWRAR
jgi:hypothetical protein